MATIKRSLPDKYYDKDYETNGIHRVPAWRILLFTLNNTSTNTYLFMMNYVSYYLMGFVGVGMVVASSFTMMMRLWDGVTDPIVGTLVDRTNGKFGKNRPFMVIGNVILCIASFIMFHVTHLLPSAGPLRFIFFIIIAMIYYIGYTCQCVVTKSAQSCLTNDPKQRPLFASFDGVYNTLIFAIFGIITPILANNYEEYGGYSSTQFFNALWIMTAIVSGIFCALSVFAISPKDRPEFFGTGTGTPQKIGLKDYWDVIKNNRAMQMLVLSASTDKLGTSAKTSAISVAMFSCICGSTLLQSNVTGVTTIPSAVCAFASVAIIATRVGQRKAMIIGSVGGIIANLAMIALWLIGDPTTMTSDASTGAINWGYFMILYLVLTLIISGTQTMAGNIVIPMTADVADYEVYRSGRYVPGLIGTLFSFVDKIVSSLGSMIAGLMFAAVGFADHNPVAGDEVTWALRVGVAFCGFGVVTIGMCCNLIAMHFYPLTKEKMESIQGDIARIKQEAMNGAAE